MSPRIPALRAAAPALVAAFALVSPVALSGPAHAGDLQAFLERAERMTTPNEKVEADVTVKSSDGTTRALRLTIDPASGGTAVLEDPATGYRSETPLGWKDGKAVEKTGAAASTLAVDSVLAGTDLRGIDFFPFWKTDYTKSFISDENTLEQTVSIYADTGRPYTLYVITFDKAKMVPRMVKYYRDSFNNLVRIRTDKNWVMVGSRPRPTEVLIKDFATNSLHTYSFAWKVGGVAVPAAGASPAAAAQ